MANFYVSYDLRGKQLFVCGEFNFVFSMTERKILLICVRSEDFSSFNRSLKFIS